MALITVVMPHKTYTVRRIYNVNDSVAERVDKYINDISEREIRKNNEDYDCEHE